MGPDIAAQDASQRAKSAAAARALSFVEDGMRVGLGSGSTARCFVDLLGARVQQGLKIVGVPTSETTRLLAEAGGIRLSTLDETPELDIAIDGTDAFDPQLRLVKGGGGALLREKIVASSARRMIVIAEASKAVARLGAFPLPIEIDRFGHGSTRIKVAQLIEQRIGRRDIVLRGGGDHPFVTDGGHYVLDCHCGDIPDADALDVALAAIPGVLGTGLFIGMASCVIVADVGGTRLVEPQSSSSALEF